MAERTLDVIINGKDNLSKTLKDTEKHVSGFSSVIQNSVAASEKFAMGIAASGAALTAFGLSSIKAANESENAQKRLETLLLNVTGATIEQADALRALAKEQMAKTSLDDDTIIAGQSQLATFQLQADTIWKLTPAMNDLAVAAYGVNVTQEQMIDMGNLVGKAMMGQTGALTRYGVTMDATQTELLQTGTQAQKAATIVDVLKQNFGGLAAGMKNTTEGQIAATRVAFGNLQEAIGGALQPAIQKLMGALTSLITILASYSWEDLTRIWNEYKTPILIAAGAIAGPLVVAFGSAALAAGAFVLSVAPVMAAGAALVTLAIGLKKAWEENFLGLRTGIQGLGLLFTNIWNGIRDTVIGIINAITAKIDAFITKLTTIQAKLKAAFATSYTTASGKTISVWDELFTAKNFAQTLGFASGGIVPGVGVGDTVPAMLTPAEEVLTADDPRHRRNGGGGISISISGPFYGADKRFAEQVGDLIAQRLRFATNYAR